MNTLRLSKSVRTAVLAAFARKIAVAGALIGLAASTHAQTIQASGQVSGVLSGPGVYTYTLTISEGSGTTTPIASLWYAWAPGAFYLPSVPTSASGGPGWTAFAAANSIQFIASAPGFYIAPGTSRTFSYTAAFSPAQLAATPNAGVTFAYAGAVDASFPQQQFNVVTVVPEPSVLATLLCGPIGFAFARQRSRRR